MTPSSSQVSPDLSKTKKTVQSQLFAQTLTKPDSQPKRKPIFTVDPKSSQTQPNGIQDPNPTQDPKPILSKELSKPKLFQNNKSSDLIKNTQIQAPVSGNQANIEENQEKSAKRKRDAQNNAEQPAKQNEDPNEWSNVSPKPKQKRGSPSNTDSKIVQQDPDPELDAFDWGDEGTSESQTTIKRFF